MNKESLIELIDQVTEIKKRFKTYYRTIATYIDKPSKKLPYQSIRNDGEFLFWKDQLEAELELLPKSKTVADLYNLLEGIIKTNHYNEDKYFVNIEAKLKVLRKLITESGTTSIIEGKIMMDKPHKLFISHSNKDSDYVEAFVDILETLGLHEDEIICSSVPPYCIPLDNKVYDWLVKEFQQSDLHVIYILSDDYYNSAASLNEMGAAWTMKHKWTGILMPGFPFSKIDGCIDKTQISIKLDDTDIKTLNFRLGELKDNLIKEFGLRLMSPTIWERKRDEFLDKISAITAKKANEIEEVENYPQFQPIVGKDDVGNIPIEPAFLLVYAAVGNGQIMRTQILGSPVEISADGKRFMADNSQRESSRWQEALDMLLSWGWVKSLGGKRQIFELTGTGYNKADWLKENMCINTDVDPLEELKHFGI